jgi:flagellar biosynthetic protein FlhB
MADEKDSDSKTEQPSEKRLHDAIERGDTPVSREIALLGSLCAYLLIDIFVLPSATPRLVSVLSRLVDDPSGWRLERSSDAIALFQGVALAGARFLAPAVLLLMAFGVAGSVVQNAPRIVPRRVLPDVSRIAVGRGAARLFGPRGWTEFFKSALKLGAVAGVVALLLGARRDALASAMFLDAGDLPSRLSGLCAQATTAVLSVVLVIAGADYVWARIHWRRDQMMSRHEVKEELKQAEGDRLMKARLRSLRLDRSRKRMLTNVPKATMVVVNPTHYAVALRYVRSEGGAPVVLAKGVDLIALKIREIAIERDIPIIEDRPLARSLHDAVAVDSVIPQEFYRAVAEIVHLLQQKRSAWPSTRKRLDQ